MAKQPKDPAQLKADFDESVELLEIACFNYDGVTFAAAKTISNLLHQLVDDRGANRSHATKLGFAATLKIWKTPTPPMAAGFSNPLVGVMMGIGPGPNGPTPRAYNLPPFLNEGHNKIPAAEASVQDWLDEPVIRLNSGDQIGRRKLVRLVRDQDAGAHSDASLDQLYVDFKQSIAISPQSEIVIMGKTTPVAPLLQNPGLASLRQIAHEFLSSIYSDAALRPQRNPRCVIYEYGNGGVLKAVRRPKGYPYQPILAPDDILIEH